MPTETRSSTAFSKRAEQLKRWEESETNKVSTETPKDKLKRIQFSDGCIFLAACAAGDKEEVQRLLDKKADINTANVDGLTALHQACIDDNLEMVEFLVEQNCDINRGDNEGWTPLHATASCGFLSIARYLIEQGANIAAVNNEGALPIDIAEAEGMAAFLQVEIEKQGIDCEAARSEEERMMLNDIQEGVKDIVHSKTGATALHVAAAKGYINVISLLIKLDYDLNKQDLDGWTPLHAAAHWAQRDACQLLAENMANMDICNYSGLTCFDIADPDVLSLLEELKQKQATAQLELDKLQREILTPKKPPPLKRRTSVNRMSFLDKTNVVLKDTFAERAQIEATFELPPEEEVEEITKEKSPDIPQIEQEAKIPVNNVISQSLEEAVPLMAPKTVPSPEKLSIDTQNEEKIAPEKVTIETPKKIVLPAAMDNNYSPLPSPQVQEREKGEEGQNQVRRSYVPPARDEESEAQRKAHAKRVRETRRSTQGVTLEDIKSAEQQLQLKKQEEQQKEEKPTSIPIDKEPEENITLPLRARPKSEESESTPQSGESEPQEGDKTPKASAGINNLRRRRPKRRVTGIVILNSDSEQGQPQDEKSDVKKESQDESDQNQDQDDSEDKSDRRSHKKKDFKKLYEEMREENHQLAEKVNKTESQIEDLKQELKKALKNNQRNSLSDLEKRERRTLERRISELEEELKEMEKLRECNQKLKMENDALIRVVSRLSIDSAH